MSTLEIKKILTPYDKEDDVLSLNMEKFGDAYVLSDLINSEGEYTFSIWHKSELDNTHITFSLFKQFDYTVQSSSNWQKFSQAVNVTSLDDRNIYIIPERFAEGSTPEFGMQLDSTVYLYEAFLSQGNLDLSWYPAPEDIEEKFAKIEIDADKITSAVFDEETGESKITQTATQLTTEIKSKTSGKSIIESINADTGDYTIKADKINLIGAVNAECIAAGAITTEKLSANSITADKIKAGEITGDKIKAETTITNKLNATNLHISGDSTFDGTLTVNNKGSIGGWDIGNGRIISQGSDGNYTKVQSTKNGWTHAFVAGAPNKDNSEGAPFYVTHAGKLYAKDAVIINSLYMHDEINNKNIRAMYTDGGVNFPDYVYFKDEVNIQKSLYANKIECSSIDSDGYLSVGTRIYVPNGRGIRGMLSGTEFDSTDALDNSTVIAYVESNNRSVFGSAENSYASEVRSPSSIYLKCNGTTGDDNNRYGICFTKHDYGSDSPFNTGSFSPVIDNYLILGRSNRRFRNVYSTNGVSTTSDRNRKHDIKILDDKYIQLFDKLHPVSYVLNDGGERTHVGFISQDVENAMEEIGMSSMDFAGFCKDRILDDDGNPLLDENGNEQNYYSLRYSEFIAINTAKIKQLETQIKFKDAAIDNLKIENINLQKQLDSQQKQINELVAIIKNQ